MAATPPLFSWPAYIEKEKAEAAPVHFFKHAPLCYNFEHFTTKIKVELAIPSELYPAADVLNLDDKFKHKPYIWFASVVKYAGYFAKLRYVGYEDDASSDFWVHMADSSIHSVGYAQSNEYPIVAPWSLYKKIPNLYAYLSEKLTHSDSLPTEFASVISDSLKSKFRSGMILELVDKKKLSRMRVSRIIETIGGRLRMKYENSEEFDDFWCHEQSELIHPVGWSVQVGHDLYATEDYKKNSLKSLEKNR